MRIADFGEPPNRSTMARLLKFVGDDITPLRRYIHHLADERAKGNGPKSEERGAGERAAARLAPMSDAEVRVHARRIGRLAAEWWVDHRHEVEASGGLCPSMGCSLRANARWASG